MGATEFALNAALAVQRWGADLAREVAVQQYFSKFMGTDDNSMIKIRKELIKKAGEKITIGVKMKLSGDGAEGDTPIEGTSLEEGMEFFNDSLFIDQRRKTTKTKGKMTEQRVPYDLRREGRDSLAIWNAEDLDQFLFMYLSGARGIMPQGSGGFHVGLTFTGRANNPLTEPNSENLIYGGNASGKADLDSSDVMALTIIERLVAKIETMDPIMQPIKVNGEDKYILLMHPFQAYAMRTSTTENDWLQIQKEAGSRGDKNLVYKNSLGEYAGMILHKHRYVIRFNDYGNPATVTAARALCLGSQAGLIAWGGDGGKNRYTWNEETDDRGNRLAITSGSIFGCKKTRYNSKDWGVIAVDTYYADPNA